MIHKQPLITFLDFWSLIFCCSIQNWLINNLITSAHINEALIICMPLSLALRSDAHAKAFGGVGRWSQPSTHFIGNLDSNQHCSFSSHVIEIVFIPQVMGLFLYALPPNVLGEFQEWIMQADTLKANPWPEVWWIWGWFTCTLVFFSPDTVVRALPHTLEVVCVAKWLALFWDLGVEVMGVLSRLNNGIVGAGLPHTLGSLLVPGPPARLWDTGWVRVCEADPPADPCVIRCMNDKRSLVVVNHTNLEDFCDCILISPD